MSAGGEVRSQSSRLSDPGGARPPTFHVAAKILPKRKTSHHAHGRTDGRRNHRVLATGQAGSPVVEHDGGLGGVEVDLAAPRPLVAPPRRPLWVKKDWTMRIRGQRAQINLEPTRDWFLTCSALLGGVRVPPREAAIPPIIIPSTCSKNKYSIQFEKKNENNASAMENREGLRKNRKQVLKSRGLWQLD